MSMAGRTASPAMAEPTSETVTPPDDPAGKAISSLRQVPQNGGAADEAAVRAVELGFGGAVDAVATSQADAMPVNKASEWMGS